VVHFKLFISIIHQLSLWWIIPLDILLSGK